jgi:hypothetical protein
MNQFQKCFIFQHESGDLSLLIRKCLTFIEGQMKLYLIPADVLPKIQWVITELLINGKKHSGVAESNLIFEFNETSLSVIREDLGRPLSVYVDEGSTVLTWPLGNDSLDRQFEIYRNGMDSLRIYTENEEKAVFQVTELEDIAMPLLLTNTSEHFGLMIIAKASDRFSYSYDQELRKNIFKTTFNY